MAEEDTLLQCYNRGCGQKFDPNNNKDDSCCHHPGEPFFHDAYKGWSCCNKKYTDFTEFLNVKGCAVSKHSNVKLPESEKNKNDTLIKEEIVEVKPIVPTRLARPPITIPMVILMPELAPSLKNQLMNSNVQPAQKPSQENANTEIAIGTLCKRGCNTTYAGPQTDQTVCTYHSGSPVFHEGLKFWTCCQKRTTDFNAFLNQVGCTQGKHLWIKDESDSANIECRWDYHQTGSHVVVSIYAKNYCPQSSTIKLNPIRLQVNLIFPQQNKACFALDAELCGIVDINTSEVTMFSTKVEIKLKKAEAGSWNKLERRIINLSEDQKTRKDADEHVADIMPQVEAVDLSDI